MPPHQPSSDTSELLTLMNGSTAGSGMQLYDRFADRVHDFVLFLTRDRGLAAEITRDVIVMTANSPTPFSTAPQLRSWLYARARDETFALLGLRGRAPAEDRVITLDPLPPTHTAADLANLVYEATAAFSERDLALLTLHLRHGLEGGALGEAMGLSEDAVDVLLPATLERVHAQATALVVLAAGLEGGGRELAQLRQDWDGTFSPLVRRRATELAEELEVLAASVPSPLDLLRQVPPSPAPPSLREAVEDRLRLTGSLGAGTSSASLASGPLTDPTIPPASGELGGLTADDATIPPGVATAPPVVALPDAEQPVVDGLSGPIPVDGLSGPIPTDALSGPIPADSLSGSGPLTTPADASGPLPPVRRGRRIPRPLAIGLGTAVALVVAAGLFRMVADTGPTAAEDVVSLATPPSITEGPSAVAAGEVPVAAGSVAPATAFQATTTAPSSVQPQAEESPARPGVLSVPATPVELSADDAASLRLTNSGGTDVDFRIADVPEWFTVSRTEGTVGAGEVAEVMVTMASALPEGDYATSLPIAWDGGAPGSVTVDVLGASERDPVMQDIQVGSRTLLARGCGLDSTEVAVTVADESPLQEVVVAARPAGRDTSIRFRLDPDPQRPGRFVGVVGPFDTAGNVTMVVEATDVRGNSAEVDGGQIAVAPCPG